MFELLIGAAFILVLMPFMAFLVFWRDGILMSIFLGGSMFLLMSYLFGTLMLEIYRG